VAVLADHGWLAEVTAPTIRTTDSHIDSASTSAVKLFGEEVVGCAFEDLFLSLPGGPSADFKGGEGPGRRLRVLFGAAKGNRFATYWQDGSEPGTRIVVLLDITHDSRLEDALSGRLREVTRAHKAGRVSSWELDLKRLRLTVPHRLPKSFGDVVRSLQFDDAMAMVHADDVAEVKTAVRRATSSGLLNVEARILDSFGREHWTLFRGRTLKDGSGEPQALAGVAIAMMSENSRRAEAERQLAMQLAVLDHLADGVIRMDGKGRIVALNSAAERMTRWRAEEAVGRRIGAVVAMKDEASDVPVSVEPAQDSAGAVSSRLIRRDGSELPVRCEVRKLSTASGEPTWLVEMRDLSELRGLESQMMFRATHDGLTGLFDRVEFERRLGDALADAASEDNSHALCYVDLDNFKIINDTCGHMAGDEMLKQIGSLLRCNFRGSDTLGRLGGDEFGVLLTDCPSAKALEIANGLCKDIKTFRFSWDDKVFNVTASVGLVNIDGQTTSVAEVLGAADGACYIAKQNGANRVEVYRPDDSVLSKRRDQLKLVQVVQHSLESDSFELYGQPIQPLYSSERPIIELLIRMREEDGNMVLPAEFMRVAEAHGLAVMIDRWVVGRALEELTGDVDPYPGAALAINISGQSLGDEAFLQHVLDQFETSRVDPSRIYFEITETAAISNLGRAMRFISELKGRGAVFVLDDFGAGLSSFGYLRNLPVGLIKIDGQFVKGLTRDPIQRALVEAINQIGQVMQMKTVAESVEDEATLAALRRIRVDYAQGYHVARPMPLDQVRASFR